MMQKTQNWYIFTAIKDGREVTRKIPWETWASARAVLLEIGFTDVKLLDAYTLRYENGNWYPV